MPKVSVVMCVYNGEKYIKQAINSILRQTFKDFEFIIIDDGSTDKSKDIISDYTDNRIILYSNSANMGLTKSLNKGIDMASGDYIARMDCDDISLPRRLEKQVDFLNRNPQIGICGTSLKTFGSAERVWKLPTEPREIRAKLLFKNAIVHPSVMMRKEFLNKLNIQYDPQYIRAQDYELWERCSRKFPIANLEEILLLYRIHPDQIGQAYRLQQNMFAKNIIKRLLIMLGINASGQEINFHMEIANNIVIGDKQMLLRVEQWLLRLVESNRVKHVFPVRSFEKVISDMWYNACINSNLSCIWILYKYFNSRLKREIEVKLSKKQQFEIIELIS